LLDLKYIRENAKAVEENTRNRGVEADVGLVVELADRRSDLIQESNELKQRQNQMARSIGRERDEEARARLIEESRAMKERLPSKERELHEVEERLRDEQSKIPNMTHPDSPIGKDDTENVEIRRWGKIPDFPFEPKDHVELGEHLGIIDFDAGAKTTGTKFYFLRGDAVLLELGLIRYAMDIIMERGYQPTITPDLARDRMLVGTGFIPRGPETQIYSVEGTDLSLVATAEIPLAGQHADEIIEERDLPLRYAGLSHCFRTEAGSHGRASRGLYRVHQFTKVEMFAFTAPDQSENMHNEMVGIEERIFQGLGLPYRNAFGEVTSTSNTTDYQARRLAIRYRKEGGRPQLLHTLNGTALAISRALISLLEIYQQQDGSVMLPKVLVPYVGKERLTSS
jgi:seryl-tRNA synthetase